LKILNPTISSHDKSIFEFLYNFYTKNFIIKKFKQKGSNRSHEGFDKFVK